MSNTAPPPSHKRHPVLVFTPGEPAGIGPDLAVCLPIPRDYNLVILADPALLAARAHQLGRQFESPAWNGSAGSSPGVYTLAQSCAAKPVPGQLDPANSRYVMDCLKRAVQGCQSGEFDALVTGPVHKGVINDAGISFTGHTEFLAAESGTSQVVMMLATTGLRVALATTHLPLVDVPRAITRTHLEGVLRILHSDLIKKFNIKQPHIRVCGLNPHAGESGHLGREEIDVITPVLDRLRAEGMQLEGPVPADTAFLPSSLEKTDAILAMYHDQGLPVLKHHDFAHAINITLGLPFVRTSVDHGTALELAGTGRADLTSLEAALAFAWRLCR